ncbi:cation-translocating P-type ATPase [Methanosphaera cuniculi]|uniref:cation-translocating P-type ATPase n=1 Tax=Methanosphaera cuniculi TaxID=1077256 RepID=UPI0026F1EE9E|nr:cation-translocating P-type ATPase [Methanosphaera cuniculi]
MTKWEEIDETTVLKKLETTTNGLSTNEANIRLEKNGKNVLKEEKKDSNLKKFLTQFTEPLMILLILAAIVSAIIGDMLDSGVIFFVVILNAYLGYSQENKAENAMQKLKSITKHTAIVIRDGKQQQINAEDIVVGDIVVLEEGDCVPADMRIIEEYEVKIDESALTGESLPIKKYAKADDDNSHSNIAFMDTFISMGRAKGAVIATGMDTEIGKIASMIQDDDKSKTPLEIKIAKLGKMLGLLSIVICIIIVVLELLQGIPLAETFMTAVSLAVAAIPEGLPAILTLTLALGMQKMAKNNVIIRKLLAVETLGSCSVICTDKTGTLTKNQLTVTKSYLTNPDMSYMISALCNNARIDGDKKIGDPTDIAALEFAYENNFKNTNTTRLNEIPLDSIRKRMATINKINDDEYILIKGAPELLLNMCTYIDNNGKITKLDENTKNEIQNKITSYTNDALRVLLLAYKKIDNYQNQSIEELECDLIFVGIIGMMDPPRENVKDAIQTCSNAGINVKMITGDHKNTASAIAKLVGIKNPENVITGSELKKLSDDELQEKIVNTNVFARVFPEQKVRIVKAVEANGEVVSMTGDGINDAPALTAADIGVAMGSGTDVAKESSDMVLQDDNFSTIIYAVEEGRTIYSNIKRFIKYQLSTNIAAIFTILLSSIVAIPLPFNPIQLLWINIIMDGPPAQSLGMEGSDENIMNIPPSDENILSKDNLTHITLIGIVMGLGTLGLYLYEMSIGTTHLVASTIAFTVFVVYQLFNVFNCRSKSNKKNKTLIIAVIGSFILQLCAIYIPFLQPIFRTTAIPLTSWILIVVVAFTVLIAEQIIRHFENNII